MGITIRVKRSDPSQDQPLDFACAASQVVVGRGEEVDLCLPDPSVSLVHMRLFERDGHLMAMDLDSVNGTRQLGQRLPTNRALKVRAPLFVGPYVLEANLCGVSSNHETGTADFARRIAMQILSRMGNQPCRLDVVQGPNLGLWVELSSDRPEALVGRGANCTLRLSDADVSREHLRLAWSAEGTVRASDLGSKNHIYVNGCRQEQATLSCGDCVRLGQTVLAFSDATDTYLRRMSQQQAAEAPASQGPEAAGDEQGQDDADVGSFGGPTPAPSAKAALAEPKCSNEQTKRPFFLTLEGGLATAVICLTIATLLYLLLAR